NEKLQNIGLALKPVAKNTQAKAVVKQTPAIVENNSVDAIIAEAAKPKDDFYAVPAKAKPLAKNTTSSVKKGTNTPGSFSQKKETVVKDQIEILKEASPVLSTGGLKQAGSKENDTFAKQVLNEKPSLNISDSNNYVKLTCQGISTNGKKSYIKFRVQNYNAGKEFSIGSINMMYIKNYSPLKRMQGEYIADNSSSNIKGELQLVYIVETPDAIEANEVFVFEMEDQSKVTKLAVNIKGENFIQKKMIGFLDKRKEF
ncbi:MAG TPA: hypothetical protein VF623_04375, partial [Segetibacter sp.]